MAMEIFYNKGSPNDDNVVQEDNLKYGGGEGEGKLEFSVGEISQNVVL